MTTDYTLVYRFNDNIAIYLGDGSTHYLTQANAQELVEAINAVITDIATLPFTKSIVGTYRATMRTDRFKEIS